MLRACSILCSSSKILVLLEVVLVGWFLDEENDDDRVSTALPPMLLAWVCPLGSLPRSAERLELYMVMLVLVIQ